MDDKNVKLFVAIITVGVLIAIAVLISSATVGRSVRDEVYAEVAAEVANEPIRQFVTDRACQFVSPPAGQGMWATCTDGTTWGVVPLEAGQPQR